MSHDYRQLCGSIQRALYDDQDAHTRSASELRNRKQIQIETDAALEAAKKKAVMMNVAAVGTDDTSTASTSSILTADTDTLHHPRDKSRPFTSVPLVQLTPNIDWSGLQRRARGIAETRKMQLGNAYQGEMDERTVGGGGGMTHSSSTPHLSREDYTRTRHLLRLDRIRIRRHERMRKEEERKKIQKNSTMILSPPSTESEEEEEEESEEEEEERMKSSSTLATSASAATLASSKSQQQQHQLRPSTLVHSHSHHLLRASSRASSHNTSKRGLILIDEARDGEPPLDAEEIEMRVRKMTRKRNKEMAGRVPVAGSNRNSKIMLSQSRSSSISASASTPSLRASRHSPTRRRRNPSIMLSSDARVTQVLSSAESEVQAKAQAEKQAKQALIERQASRDKLRTEKEASLQQQVFKQQLLDETQSLVMRRVSISEYLPMTGFMSDNRLLDRSGDVAVGQSPTNKGGGTGGEVSEKKEEEKEKQQQQPYLMSRRASVTNAKKLDPPTSQHQQQFVQVDISPSLPQHSSDSAEIIIIPYRPSSKESTAIGTDDSLAHSTSSPALTMTTDTAASSPPKYLEYCGHMIRTASLTRLMEIKEKRQLVKKMRSQEKLQQEDGSEEKQNAFGVQNVKRRVRRVQPLVVTSTPDSFSSVAVAPSPTTAAEEGDTVFLTALPPFPSATSPSKPLMQRQASQKMIESDSTQLQQQLQEQEQYLPSILTSFESNLALDDPFAFLRGTASHTTASTSTTASSSLPPSTPRLSYAHQRHEKSELASKIMMSFTSKDMKKISDALSSSHHEQFSSSNKEEGKDESSNGTIDNHNMTCSQFISITRKRKLPSRSTYLDDTSYRSAMRYYRSETEALCEMFNEIDVNGDGTLSFREFTSYLVELAHTQYATEQNQVEKEGYQQGGAGGRQDSGTLAMNNAKAILSSSSSASQYELLDSNNNIPTTLSSSSSSSSLLTNSHLPPHTSDYTFIKYIPPLHSFITLQSDMLTRFNVHDEHTLHIKKVVRAHSQRILDIEYLPIHQLLVTSSEDRSLKFWTCDWHGGEKGRREEEKEEEVMKRKERKYAIRQGGVSGMMKKNVERRSSSDDDGSEERKNYVDDFSNLSEGKSTLRIKDSTTPSSSPSRNAHKSPSQPQYTLLSTWRVPLAQHHLCWNKTRLYSSDNTGRILVWNVDTSEIRATLNGHQSQVNCMLPLPDMLASGSHDTTIRLWDNITSTEVSCLRGKHTRAVHALAYSSTYSLLASGGEDDTIYLWDTNSKKFASSFQLSKNWYTTLPGFDSDCVKKMECIDGNGNGVSGNTNELIIGTHRGSFLAYDLRMMSIVQEWEIPCDADMVGSESGGGGGGENDGEESGNNKHMMKKKSASKSLTTKPNTGSSSLDNDTTGDANPHILETEHDRLRSRSKVSLSSFCFYRDEEKCQAYQMRVKMEKRKREEEKMRVMKQRKEEQKDDSTTAALPLHDDIPLDIPRDPRSQMLISASGSSLLRFGRGVTSTRNITHDSPILHAEFVHSSLTIFTCTKKQVRIWCVLTGRLVKEYNHLLQQDHSSLNQRKNQQRKQPTSGALQITSACLDQRKRKFILGDNAGNIYIFNYNTGALMHKLSNTRGESSVGGTMTQRNGGNRKEADEVVMSDIINLRCIVKTDTTSSSISSSTIVSSADSSPSTSTANLSIQYLHSLGSSIHIHVDDPDHSKGTGQAAVSASSSSSSPASASSVASSASRTILHSSTAHRASITCITQSSSQHGGVGHSVIFSAGKDGTIVCYPNELAGSPTQRIVPAEVMIQLTGLSSFQQPTPILSLHILHPSLKLLACSDSLGYILFFLFTKTQARMIGYVRNTRKIGKEDGEDANGAMEEWHHEGIGVNGSDQDATSSLSRQTSLRPTRSSSILFDNPPVLSLHYDHTQQVMYTTDDAGEVKGWMIGERIVNPYMQEQRRRVASMNASGQTTESNIASWHDEQDLPSEQDVMRVYHPSSVSKSPRITLRHLGGGGASGTRSGESNQVNAQAASASTQAPNRYEFKLHPTFTIKAHNGPCTGIQIVDPAVDCKEMMTEGGGGGGGGGGGKDVIECRSPPPVLSPAPHKRTISTRNTNTANHSSVSTASSSAAISSISRINPRASLQPGQHLRFGSTSASMAVSRTITPRGGHAEHENGIVVVDGGGGKHPAVSDRLSKHGTLDPLPFSSPFSMSRKEQDALSEANLKRWDEQAWNALDNPADEIMTPQMKQTMTNSSSSVLTSPRIVSARTTTTSAIVTTATHPLTSTFSGPCVLTSGTDGCVHLFSLLSPYRKLGTLKQGFTRRNTNVTPSSWAYQYPVQQRVDVDERELSDLMKQIDREEAKVQSALSQKLEQEQSLQRERDKQRRFAHLESHPDAERKEQFDPFRNVMYKKQMRVRLRAAAIQSVESV